MSKVQLTVVNQKLNSDPNTDKSISVHLRAGLGMQAVSAKWTLGIEYDCRKADCGICLVKVLEGAEGLSKPTVAEQDFLNAMHAGPDERLCCQVRLLSGNIVLSVDDDGLEL